MKKQFQNTLVLKVLRKPYPITLAEVRSYRSAGKGAIAVTMTSRMTELVITNEREIEEFMDWIEQKELV